MSVGVAAVAFGLGVLGCWSGLTWATRRRAAWIPRVCGRSDGGFGWTCCLPAGHTDQPCLFLGPRIG
jgi:hypothetical protein